ncbi:PilZ domain-containing protein [Ensifer sp. LCM 4579]|uniref:PilZ domain-containing protein n=1 Tax=Ensifer sp. LCM 4579 TaxID=1848292 RepID=UPI000A9ECA56|nr:PilZ domain-containing protein [Ensifer sp. LCM 4579]
MQQSTMYSLAPSPLYDERHERFAIAHAGTLMAVQPGLGGVSIRACRMIEISRGGARFSVGTTIGLPLHYYLHVVGTNRRIGCAEIHRAGDKLAVKFIKTIDESFLHEIVRLDYFTGESRNARTTRDPRRLTAPARPFFFGADSRG